MKLHSNCIIWALLLYRRRRAKGKVGYLMVRRSRYGKFPHMLYAEKRHYGMCVVSFVPTDPRHKTIPPPLFKGSSKWATSENNRRSKFDLVYIPAIG